MPLIAWSTFRERWQIFAGSIITVGIGVALVQASLLALISAATAHVPPHLSEEEALLVREGYDGAASLLGTVLVLSTFIAVFIVASTFAFTVAQRRRELGLLRLTGAGRRQIRVLLLGEAVLLGLVGSVLGVVLGLPVLRLQLWMLDGFGFLPPGFDVPWRSWVVWVSVGAGVLIAVLGVLAASRRASRVRPLEALRETGRAAHVMTASRWVLGLLFVGGGVTVAALVPGVESDAAVPLAMLISFMLVVGFSALAPLIVPLVGGLFGVFARGTLPALAQANLRSDARRSASTAAPIMVLFALVVGIAGTLASLSEAEHVDILRTVQGDIVVSAEQPAATELAAVDGVGAVSEEVSVPFEIRWEEGDGEVWYQLIHGSAADPVGYSETHNAQTTAGELTDLDGDAIAVSPSADPSRDWQVGDALQVRIDGQEHELRIVALLPETLSGPFYLLSPDLAPPDTGPWWHVVRLGEGADDRVVAERLAEFGEVATVEEWIADMGAEEEQLTFNVMIALLGLASLYTVVAMINAVVISASERRGEFAAARVAGLTRGQVVGVALWESQAVVVIGLLLGGIAAAGTILGNVVALRDLVGITVVGVPWGLLAGLALGAAVVVGTTAVITTLAATRIPPVRLVAARD